MESATNQLVGEWSIGSLRFSVVDDVEVLPLAFSTNTGTVRGGACGPLPDYAFQWRATADGGKRSLSRFKHGDMSGFMIDEEPAWVPGVSLYLGPLSSHFGHFITESLSRAWMARFAPIPYERIVALPETTSYEQRRCMSMDSLHKWQLDILRFLDLPELHLAVSRQRFERLIIPEPGGLLFAGANPQYVDFLSSSAQRKGVELGGAVSGNRVFLRRRELSDCVLGEGYLAQFLESQGYSSVYPEDYPVSDQIAYAMNATHAVGVQGSAFHVFNLIGSSSVKVLTIQRQNTTLTRLFERTLAPAVAELSTALSGFMPIQGGTAVLIDASKFLEMLVRMDDHVRPGEFDWELFYSSVRADLLSAEAPS